MNHLSAQITTHRRTSTSTLQKRRGRKKGSKNKPKGPAKARGPARGSKFLRDMQEDFDLNFEVLAKERMVFVFPPKTVNGGKPYTWKLLPSKGMDLRVSVGSKLKVEDGMKGEDVMTEFPLGKDHEMIRVRCLETHEVRIILKSAYPEKVLGLTEERWKKLDDIFERRITVDF